MRRRCPGGKAAQPGGSGAACASGTAETRMPPGCMAPLSSTTIWLRVNLRPPVGLNCTLARSTAGQVSPDPMVRARFFNVAVAPVGGGGDIATRVAIGDPHLDTRARQHDDLIDADRDRVVDRLDGRAVDHPEFAAPPG